MEEDRSIGLISAVAMAGWTHNTNVNHLGFSPLQLVTGKSVTIPGVTFETPATASSFDSDIVRNIIQNHCLMMKEYTTAEFTRKLLEISELKRAAYNDIRYSPGFASTVVSLPGFPITPNFNGSRKLLRTTTKPLRTPSSWRSRRPTWTIPTPPWRSRSPTWTSPQHSQ